LNYRLFLECGRKGNFSEARSFLSRSFSVFSGQANGQPALSQVAYVLPLSRVLLIVVHM
jgi:hypothetical protein